MLLELFSEKVTLPHRCHTRAGVKQQAGRRNKGAFVTVPLPRRAGSQLRGLEEAGRAAERFPELKFGGSCSLTWRRSLSPGSRVME